MYSIILISHIKENMRGSSTPTCCFSVKTCSITVTMPQTHPRLIGSTWQAQDTFLRQPVVEIGSGKSLKASDYTSVQDHSHNPFINKSFISVKHGATEH